MLQKDGISPTLGMFLLDAKKSNISDGSINTSNGIDLMNAKKCIFLCSKSDWYDILIQFMKDIK